MTLLRAATNFRSLSLSPPGRYKVRRGNNDVGDSFAGRRHGVVRAGLPRTGGLAVAVHGRRIATPLIYGGTLVVALVALGAALTPSSAPPGEDRDAAGRAAGHRRPLPHRCAGAFFLTVVNLGAAVTSLYALGYGRHEHSPQRVLPFYPAFLAA